MTSKVIVTGGDAGYFPMIADLLASVRAQPGGGAFGLSVIDVGLAAAQRDHLAQAYGARILDVSWEFPEAERRAARPADKLSVVRAFLDRHHPEADLIAWIDGDAWVQDIAPLALMFEAASRGRLAIVSQTSRYSGATMSIEWVCAPLGLARVRSILFKNARKAGLDVATCRALATRPTLNAGCFALAREAPHWDAMRRHMGQAVGKGKIFTLDQLAIGLAVHVDGLPVELCPETCNYMGPWRATDDGTALVEYYLPHARVGVVHLAGQDRMRADPSATVAIPTISGGSVERSLRRPAWAG